MADKTLAEYAGFKGVDLLYIILAVGFVGTMGLLLLLALLGGNLLDVVAMIPATI